MRAAVLLVLLAGCPKKAPVADPTPDVVPAAPVEPTPPSMPTTPPVLPNPYADALGMHRWQFETLDGTPVRDERWIELSGRDLTMYAGCNTWFANQALVGELTFVVGPMASTRMLCPDSDESDYAHLLGEVDGYRLEDGVLTLLTGQQVRATLR